MSRIIDGKSITIVSAVLLLLFHIQITVWAQQSQEKAMPGINLFLLTDKAPQPNIAFVTSLSSYNGNFGGLDGADLQCQSLATAASLPQNTYIAWLSTSTSDAIDRLGASRGWVRVDGMPFADTKDDIAAEKIFHPLAIDENGSFINEPWSNVWTGTDYDGTVHPNGTCNNWTSSNGAVQGVMGSVHAVGGVFTAGGNPSCNDNYHLYCFGVDNSVPVSVEPAAGRIAFHTSSAWIPSTGLATADQLCKDEAGSAGLSGSFKAMLATVGASASTRFDVNGLPWVRPDGTAIAPTAAEVFSAEFLDTAINQSADGLQYYGNYGIWTGAPYPDTAGTADTTCNNWTSSNASDNAMTGSSGYTYQRMFFGRSSNICDNTVFRLYCLQE